jgi:hypothetical protein
VDLFLKLQFYADNIASKYHHHQQQQGVSHPGFL